jgi:Arc/MetJ family transcription regulator
MRMKRTTLVLDEALLEEALRLSGERTYSRTVERALSELVRRARAGRILELVGSGAWEGDLPTMRGDAVVAESQGLHRTRGKRGRRVSR